MQHIHSISVFPAASEPVAMPADFVSLLAVIYRDSAGIVHDVEQLRVNGNQVYGMWPEDCHTDLNIRFVYLAKDLELTDQSVAKPAKVKK